MITQDGPIGALVVARDTDAEPFNAVETAAAEVFASAAAVGIALGGTRDTLEAMHLVSEHERIARDLHDTVIQRLFALGMGLQGAQRLSSGAVGERISRSVQAIDEVIREIRETIFDLNRPQGADLDVRQRVRAVAGEVGGQVGFTPRTTFRGPVEAAVSDEMISHLLAVLREALTNVGRHARASTVDVVVAATAGHGDVERRRRRYRTVQRAERGPRFGQHGRPSRRAGRRTHDQQSATEGDLVAMDGAHRRADWSVRSDLISSVRVFWPCTHRRDLTDDGHMVSAVLTRRWPGRGEYLLRDAPSDPRGVATPRRQASPTWSLTRWRAELACRPWPTRRAARTEAAPNVSVTRWPTTPPWSASATGWAWSTT